MPCRVTGLASGAVGLAPESVPSARPLPAVRPPQGLFGKRAARPCRWQCRPGCFLGARDAHHRPSAIAGEPAACAQCCEQLALGASIARLLCFDAPARRRDPQRPADPGRWVGRCACARGTLHRAPAARRFARSKPRAAGPPMRVPPPPRNFPEPLPTVHGNPSAKGVFHAVSLQAIHAAGCLHRRGSRACRGWAQAEQTVRIGNAGPLTGAPRIGARTTRTAPGSPSKT